MQHKNCAKIAGKKCHRRAENSFLRNVIEIDFYITINIVICVTKL